MNTTNTDKNTPVINRAVMLFGTAAVLLTLTALAHAGWGTSDVGPICLRCEYRGNPMGIDAEKPRLSWIIADLESESENRKSEIPRGQKQTAYQVLVASTPELLAKDQGDLWDSGKVASDQSIQVEYAGPSTSLRTGKPAGKVEGVKFLRMENGAAVYKVGSGRYVFEVTKDVSQ